MEWLSDRARQFRASLIGEISRLAEACDAINLSEGFPDYPAPDFVKKTGTEAILKDFNQYRYSQVLCNVIADLASRRLGVPVDGSSEVSICCGQSGAFSAAILATINPGDEVIVLEPAYETYGPCVINAGGIPIFVTLCPPNWEVTEEILESGVSSKTKAIVINSPNNPTGRVFSHKELQIVSNFCCKNNILAITDEVYEYLVFDSNIHESLISFEGMKSRTILTSSISKTFCITGWRIGWAISPPAICTAINKLHCKLVDSPPAPFQEAAIIALQSSPDYYSSLKRDYQKKKDFICQSLRKAGFSVPFSPEGGMFIFAKIPKSFNGNDVEFTKWLIEKLRVAVVPGSNFFPSLISNSNSNLDLHSEASSYKVEYVRVAFCKSERTLEMASAALSCLKEQDLVSFC